jgi:hypothetical protein
MNSGVLVGYFPKKMTPDEQSGCLKNMGFLKLY